MSRAVIDQPGIRITIIGLSLVLFFGLALRSQISDSRIQMHLNEALSRIQNDVKLDYESARLNLSKWGLPLPVLEIKRIRVSAQNASCRSSQIFIDELQVPLSLSALLGGSAKIPKLRLNDVELRLADLETCFESSRKAAHPKNENNSLNSQNRVMSAQLPSNRKHEQDSDRDPEQRSAQKQNIFQQKTGAELSDIYIEKLKIVHANFPEQPILLKQLNAEMKYSDHSLSEIEITSRASAVRDTRSNLYYLNSNFFLHLQKLQNTDQLDVTLSLEGKMLDGDLNFFTHYIQGQPKLNLDFVVSQVSAKAFLPLIAPQRKEIANVFERTPISLSFRNNTEIDLKSPHRMISRIKNLSVNIETAFIKASELNVKHTDGVTELSPFELIINQLPLTKFKNTDFLKDRTESFESLGLLSGKLKYTNEKLIVFNGLLRGLEVVFSNRGRRDFQKIDEMSFFLKRQDDGLNLTLDNLIVEQQKVEGEVHVSHHVSDMVTKVDLKLSGALLNSRVWDQFTYVSQSPKIDVSFNYLKNTQTRYDLKLFSPQMLLPGLDLKEVRLDINSSSAESDDAKAQSSALAGALRAGIIRTNESFFENKYINDIFSQSIGVNGQSYRIDRFNLLINGEDWRNLRFSADAMMYEADPKKPATALQYRGTASRTIGFQSHLKLIQKNKIYDFGLDILDGQNFTLRNLTELN